MQAGLSFLSATPRLQVQTARAGEFLECEQLPNGQFGKTGCGNGTGTALTGDWPAGELWPTETRARRRSWSHRVSKTVAPQQIVTMLTGAPSNHAHTVVTTHPGANPLALPGTSSRNQADKRHQHQTDHIHTHTCHATRTGQHSETHTYPSTHAELTFSAATNCGGGQSHSCLMPVATLFSFF